MSTILNESAELPSRWQGILFGIKTRLFQMKRLLVEVAERPKKHPISDELHELPVIAEIRSPLWTEMSASEFPLTAGKVENLRAVARALNGLVIPQNETFSFWRQIGRTTKKRGYTVGRELREGCLVPSIGGGLCQVTGLLYQAALKAGMEIVERHEHSRMIPGSMADKNLDATVFWNYVDLRFKADFAWRIEVILTASELVILIKAACSEKPVAVKPSPQIVKREMPSGDCLTCDQIECFRHPSAVSKHKPAQGYSSFLLDSIWPEFDKWCGEHSRAGDRWLLPLDADKWKKSNYAWSLPQDALCGYATLPTLLRSFKQRRLPAQGAIRQAALLKSDAKLAAHYAKQLTPECRHLVISQNLLPHLWKLGVLGGRTFDVLIERWPLYELQKRLDEAYEKNADSPTLADFRADEELVKLEKEALDKAGRLITPHREIAKLFRHRAWLLDWIFPEGADEEMSVSEKSGVLFPASPLGRKGIYEVAKVLRNCDQDLLVTGRASEGGIYNPLDAVKWRHAKIEELERAKCVLLPAWVEHQPRIALRALAMGVPVVASTGCGLSPHPLLTEVKAGDVEALRLACEELLS